VEIYVADVLQKYIELLKQSRSGTMRDASFLPYPKDVIKAALQGLLERLAPDEAEARDAVMTAYMRLCDFPENLSNDEWDAADIMRRIFIGGTSDDANMARGKLTLEVGATYERLMQRQAAECTQLAKELQSMNLEKRN
jgi:hypothetical protein